MELRIVKNLHMEDGAVNQNKKMKLEKMIC